MLLVAWSDSDRRNLLHSDRSFLTFFQPQDFVELQIGCLLCIVTPIGDIFCPPTRVLLLYFGQRTKLQELHYSCAANREK